jgi:hypothetical protein
MSRNALELCKSSYKYFTPKLFLSSCFGSISFNSLITASGRGDVKQLLLIIFEECPWGKAVLSQVK